ncbi:Ca-activated chloride channel family protein [Sulfuritortus calidifontis]|uniref:Ca-activated chloride channel family protein n=1 Tax=Sulfuritortus calidifontis TaxID=1914471 RepID=A0A4R3JXM5_9PROT|nr:VWA domain-containing protein [Sulfuritortus calidifontis]TCS73095.1 Ca-activated chloride channel family protein [Sulfuritortus calidifontis]
MLELGQPLWLIALLPIAAWLAFGLRRSGEGMSASWRLKHPHLLPAAASEARLPGARLPLWLTALGLALIAVALSQPREVGQWLTPPPEGRDIVLVIDTSQTMSIDDFQLGGKKVERLAVLKAVMGRFIEGRPADRFGVIAFGSQAATLTPPTFDRVHVLAQLQRLQVGMAGDNTALGDALGLALKQLPPKRLRPALILVSDDAPSNSGDLTPAEALAVARQLGVAIHTVQVGSDLFAEGRVEVEAADPQPNMADLARVTGGHHYFVRGTEDAEQVIRDIGALEKTLARPARHREIREWYWLPLALAAALLTLGRVLAMRREA